MTVLYLAAIPEDMGGTKSLSYFDSNYTDQSIAMSGGHTSFFSAEPTGKLYIHFRMRTNSGWASSGSDGYWCTGRSDDGTANWRIETSNGSNALLTYGTGGSTTAYTVDLLQNTIYTFDITEEVVSGVRTVELWINGALALTNTSLATTRSGRIVFDNNDNGGGTNYFSEFYVTDGVSTINTRLAKLNGSSAGNYTDGVGSYADLDEVGSSGLELASTEKYSWNAANLVLSPSNIGSVLMKIRGNTAGPTQFTPFTRISSTDYNGTTALISDTPIIQEWATNPATAAGWLEAAVNALEVGLEGVA